MYHNLSVPDKPGQRTSFTLQNAVYFRNGVASLIYNVPPYTCPKDKQTKRPTHRIFRLARRSKLQDAPCNQKVNLADSIQFYLKMLRCVVIFGRRGGGGGGLFQRTKKKPHEAYNNEHIFTQLVLGVEMFLKWPLAITIHLMSQDYVSPDHGYNKGHG